MTGLFIRLILKILGKANVAFAFAMETLVTQFAGFWFGIKRMLYW